ncbi:RHS repeat-associated core domain-containing protein [Fulvivirgaceae bacterium PWU5]|uniref:RHS repeat-associated core domain-containing protein n=1 Tax=Dawidia cretensis TaxID=2782350 RepID=A0AAP2DUR9_9BACT|nr:DUF6443 domain-containing protein [Dawidia cretensis]MBT1707601.1 RHS repeat-associated core domain-containing protein [Dawidia cretensis]
MIYPKFLRALLVSSFLLAALNSVMAQQYTVTVAGNRKPALGKVELYTAVFSPSAPPWGDYWWTVTGGRFVPGTDTPTSCQVLWDTPGAGSVKLTYYSTAGQFNPEAAITITGATLATPAATFIFANNCNSTTITRNISPPTGGFYEWWWQTSETGESTTLGNGASITRTTDGPLYLRARLAAAPNTWSAEAQFVGGVSIITSAPVVPSTATDAHVIAPGSAPATVSVEPVVAATRYAWYTQATGGTALTNVSANSYTLNLTQTQTFYVVSMTELCSSTSRKAVTAYWYAAPVISATNGGEASLGHPVTLSVPANYDSYVWLDDTDTPISGATGPTFDTQVSGGYKVRVTKAAAQPYTSAPYVVRRLSNNDQNYIVSNTVQVSGIKTPTEVLNLPIGSNTPATQFFDGIGRPMQTVVTQGSPGHHDLVTPIVYDAFGRTTRTYLPIALGEDGWYKQNKDLIDESTGNYKGAAASFYGAGSANKIADDTRPFSEVTLEPSPLSRPVKEYGPGQDWYTNDKSVQRKYRANAADDRVICWKIDVSGMPVPRADSATHGKGVLYVNETLDEHGVPIYEFKDKRGHMILKRALAQRAPYQTADTYYIYDDFGLLRFVLQPELVKVLTSGTAPQAPTTGQLTSFAFQYRYDVRRRMIEKRVPGAQVIYMVYDARDRIVLTQDGRQRAAGQWMFSKYDELNRPVLTGLMDTAGGVTREQMQTEVMRHFGNNSQSEQFVGNVAGNMFGYTNKTYPVHTTAGVADPHKCLSVSYYDSYDYRTLWPGDYAYHTDALQGTANGVTYTQPTEARGDARGATTGTMVRVLDEDRVWPLQSFTWLKTAMYYDNKLRVIQTVGDNYRGGVDRQSTVYDFPGKVLYTRTTHTTADLAWKDVVGTRVTGNRIFRNITNNSWGQSGAASQQILPAGQNGWVEFTASETGKPRMLGLSAQNTDANYTSIGYAFYLRVDGSLAIRESGIERKILAVGFKPGDILRIARVGTAIKYYQNGLEVYPAGTTVAQTPSTGQLLVDVAFSDRYGSFVNIKSSFSQLTQEVNRRYVYDHGGRLTELYHSLGHGTGITEVLLAKSAYNELGQAVDKGLHGVQGAAAQQSVDYRYNIRGWLTSINNAALTADDSNDDTNDYFGMNLAYNVVDTGLGNTAAYNGNISGVTWSNNLGLSPVQQKGYTYNYDPMNRLVSSLFQERTVTPQGADSWLAYTDGQYAERDIQYDLNGNILQLKRNDGRTTGTMDLLSYDYGTGATQSNQLLKVADTGDKKAGFTEGTDTDSDYTYDENGNMTRDLNKRIGVGTTAGISYNVLNLPDMVTRGENTVRYIYDAMGRKLMQQVDFISASKQTDYIGEFVYESDVLQFINHEEGRIVMAGNKTVIANTGESLDEVTAVNATLSNVVVGEEHYIRAVAVATGSLSGILPVGSAVSVQAGERYKVRVKGYRGSGGAGLSSDARIQFKVNGILQNLPAAVLPYGSANNGAESWVEQEITIPAGGTSLEVGVAWASARSGEQFFINEFELVKLENQDPEYQYFLKDHLGNVRLTFTSRPITAQSFATDFEGENDGTFENYSNSPYDLVDHTDLGTVKQNVQKLNGGANGRVGVAKTFAVMPGDVISAIAYGKYMNVSGTANTNSLITSLAAAFGVSARSTGDQLAVYQGLNSYASLVANGDHLDDDESAPKAFVTILFFDKDHNLVDAAWDQMTTTGAQTSATIKQPHDEVSITATAPESGFAYVFVSNEHPTFVDIYYDDVTFTHTPSAIVAMDDYYAFGMNFNSIARQNGAEQRYLYNGKEKQNELGLDWLDYGARMYMPEIGRWGAVDNSAERGTNYSPYNYAFDSPIRYVDPDGNWPWESKHIRQARRFARETGGEFSKNGNAATVNIYQTATYFNALEGYVEEVYPEGFPAEDLNLSDQNTVGLIRFEEGENYDNLFGIEMLEANVSVAALEELVVLVPGLANLLSITPPPNTINVENLVSLILRMSSKEKDDNNKPTRTERQQQKKQKKQASSNSRYGEESEHTSNQNNANRETHERGRARKQKDKGGEKADSNRYRTKDSKKRKQN